MWCKVNAEVLTNLVNKQIERFFVCEGIEVSKVTLETVKKALDRLEHCFYKISSNYFWKDNEPAFKIEHTVQYSIFLYMLSNELYKEKNDEGASYVYYLNKALHSVDWFYAIDLPEHFCAEHPVGSVLGRAVYGDYFFIYQGATVGGNRKKGILRYPTIGNNVIMYANSTILGDSHIGNNVIISANTYIKDEVIPDNCIVFGQSPNLVIKHKDEAEIMMFNHVWKF